MGAVVNRVMVVRRQSFGKGADGLYEQGRAQFVTAATGAGGP